MPRTARRAALGGVLTAFLTACGGLGPARSDGSGPQSSFPPASAAPSPGLISTVVGTGEMGTAGIGGPADRAELRTPIDLAFDDDGQLYIAERLHHRIVVVDPDGIMSVAAGTVDADGNGQAGFSGDGGPATEAELNNASSVAVSPDGNLYIADTGNHRVRMVDADGIITTVAGTGERGFAGDGGPATEAQLSWPTGMTFGADGALYVADTDNHRVRRIDPDGTIATVAGTGEVGVSPDGTLAIEAMLGDSDDHVPNGLAIDPAGRLLITDQGNCRIWMIEEGRLRAVAGNGEYASSGDGGPATAAGISGPLDIAVGPDGTLYIATHTHGMEGNEVRVVDGRGIIATIAGTGEQGYAGDGGPATRALLNIPSAVAVGPDGDLYIADAVNNRVRKVTLHGG